MKRTILVLAIVAAVTAAALLAGWTWDEDGAAVRLAGSLIIA